MTRAINGRDEAINREVIRLRNLSSVSPTTEREGLGHFDLPSCSRAPTPSGASVSSPAPST